MTTTYKLYNSAVSGGSIEDPIEDTKHSIEDSHFTVENAASAAILEAKSPSIDAVDEPSTKAVQKAQKALLGEWATSSIVINYEESQSRLVGMLEMDIEEGYDPESGSFNGGNQFKVFKTHEKLVEEGYDLEAEYMRHLPSVAEQNSFRDWCREEVFDIDLI